MSLDATLSKSAKVILYLNFCAETCFFPKFKLLSLRYERNASGEVSFVVYVRRSVCCRNLVLVAFLSLCLTYSLISKLGKYADVRSKQVDYLSVWSALFDSSLESKG